MSAVSSVGAAAATCRASAAARPRQTCRAAGPGIGVTASSQGRAARAAGAANDSTPTRGYATLRDHSTGRGARLSRGSAIGRANAVAARTREARVQREKPQ